MKREAQISHEGSLTSKSGTSLSSRVRDKDGNIKTVDKYGNKFKQFGKGDVNPKGGVYSFDCGERVYVVDEGVFGNITGETQLYCWVKVDGEELTAKLGRRKLKHNIRSSIGS